MAGNPFLSLLALILTAGGLLLNIFIILSGTHVNVRPINLIYFLEAGGSTWTYFSVCTLSGSQNSNCGSIHAALPFDPASQGFSNVPAGITGSHNFYYYMSRVAWSFYLIASFFAAITLFSGIFACCTRIFGVLSGLNAFMALASQAVCAALMTAWTVKARNAYTSAGQTAGLGRYAYGFTWASFVCFFLAMVFFCTSGGRSKKKNTEEDQVNEHRDTEQIDPAYNTTGSTYQTTGPTYQTTTGPTYQATTTSPTYEATTTNPTYQVDGPTYPAGATPIQPAAATGGFFSRNSGTKNRESGVKDEYS